MDAAARLKTRYELTDKIREFGSEKRQFGQCLETDRLDEAEQHAERSSELFTEILALVTTLTSATNEKGA